MSKMKAAYEDTIEHLTQSYPTLVQEISPSFTDADLEVIATRFVRKAAAAGVVLHVAVVAQVLSEMRADNDESQVAFAEAMAS